PLNASDGAVTTQFPMTTLEELGLLKMDFLGLRTLTVIDNAVKLIKKNHHINLDIEKINDEDSKVYELIASGSTDGIFQLESSGMKAFMKELAPTSMEDIIAGISLYRPGPMDFIPKYIQGKKDATRITYTHPSLKPILENTYGCIVYQEQVMQIVRDLAGYSLGRSDLLRRAMSKKKSDVMQKEQAIFLYGDGKEVDGCIKRGIPKETAEQIFADMVDFAKYAFNKSHAAAYAIIAYQTAYLKTYYKVEFMAALMTSVMDISNKITIYIDNCKKMAIEVQPPDINSGFAYFDAKDNHIIYGLAAIKNVGRNVIDRIVEEREKRGKFKSLTDFYNRMEAKDTNKRSIESLIFAGAFDSLGGKRSQYIAAYKQISSGISLNRKNNVAGQMDLFALNTGDVIEDKDHLPMMEEFDQKDLLSYEKEVMGIYLSGHPLDKVRSVLEKYTSVTSGDLEYKEDEDEGPYDGQRVAAGGILVDKRIIFTKTNKKMAFLTLEDTTGTMEVIIFPTIYEQFAKLSEESVFVVKGRISIKEETTAVILADDITSLEILLNPGNQQCILLLLDEKKRTKEIREKLVHIFNKYPGKTKIIVENVEDGSQKAFPSRYNVQPKEELRQELIALLGEKSIVVNK
ncbi:MAG: polymerase alpha subunit, partial [Clostridia bacterium]|nr:polymerase alpha subunit [Clostridia bacterium]